LFSVVSGDVKELMVALEKGASAWGSRGNSEDKWVFDVIVIVLAVVLNLLLPVFSKMVDADTVGVRVDDGKEFPPELDKLRVIHLALEDGILDALAVVEAGFRDLTKAFLSGFGDGGNVVGEEDIHGETLNSKF
jgi:hypothetical protein